MLPKAENRGVVVTKAGSYLRLTDSCITPLKAQGPSRTCDESKGGEEEGVTVAGGRQRGASSMLRTVARLQGYLADKKTLSPRTLR